MSDDECEQLTTIAAKYTAPYFEVVRAKIVLFPAVGLENQVIAARLDLPRRIVSKWRKRFYKQRLPGLVDDAHSGRPTGFPPRVVVAVKALACELPKQPGVPLSRFSTRDFAALVVERGITASISGTTAWQWLAGRHLAVDFSQLDLPSRSGLRAESRARPRPIPPGWEGDPLAPNDYGLSADEKPIQPRAPRIRPRHRRQIGTTALPSRPRCRRSPRRTLAQARAGPSADSRQLVEPDRDRLLDFPAQGVAPFAIAARPVPCTDWIVRLLLVGFAVGSAFASGGCSGMCDHATMERATSPDGRRVAVVYARSCGPTTGTTVNGSVLPASESKLPDRGNVFRGDSDYGKARLTKEGYPWAAVTWLSATEMQIRYDDRGRVVKSETRVGDVVVRYVPER